MLNTLSEYGSKFVVTPKLADDKSTEAKLPEYLSRVLYLYMTE